VGGIDFEVISSTENSNQFPKTRFWKEKLIEVVVTFGPTTHANLVFIRKYAWGFFGSEDCLF
jgi:hypothetical protein